MLSDLNVISNSDLFVSSIFDQLPLECIVNPGLLKSNLLILTILSVFVVFSDNCPKFLPS